MISEDIQVLNDFLKTTSYHLGCIESNMVILGSDESIVSQTALIPINPEELVFKNGTVKSYIYATSYHNNKYLPWIQLSGCPRNLDLLYRS